MCVSRLEWYVYLQYFLLSMMLLRLICWCFFSCVILSSAIIELYWLQFFQIWLQYPSRQIVYSGNWLLSCQRQFHKHSKMLQLNMNLKKVSGWKISKDSNQRYKNFEPNLAKTGIVVRFCPTYVSRWADRLKRFNGFRSADTDDFVKLGSVSKGDGWLLDRWL